ncbi:MAG: hypothetical protein LBD24_09235 [Spirochaetaceae bacterium]|nr:hypothetical protein [Spirochaetaceae bacterium]
MGRPASPNPTVAASCAAPRTTPSPNNAQQRTALEQPEAARSVAAPGQHGRAHRTGCCTIRKQQAALFKTVGDGPEAAEAGGVVQESEIQ